MSLESITLGGTIYEIPKLTIRQNRHVEVLASRHREFFVHMAENKSLDVATLTDDEADDFVKLIYHTLTRVQPALTFDQFMGMNISMRDILLALPVCLKQSGLFRPVTQEAPPTGEATPPLIGTA